MNADLAPEMLRDLVALSLDDGKALDVRVMDVRELTSITDYMVVASGRSTRQVASIAQKLAEKIKQDGYGSVRLEGLPAADWVVIDAGDVVIHLFRPEVRSFYNIERMWSFGENGQIAAGGNA